MTEPTTVEKAINTIILADKTINTNQISDGYHTFGDLYEHRIELWIALCAIYSTGAVAAPIVWRSKFHSDGTEIKGWFLLGMGVQSGLQITYHLPEKYWDRCAFAHDAPQAPAWDGHSSADVLHRLRCL